MKKCEGRNHLKSSVEACRGGKKMRQLQDGINEIKASVTQQDVEDDLVTTYFKNALRTVAEK